jgi:hypothetical protein
VVVRTKCVIVSQGVVTPQLPVYVCRSGNSHQETLIQSYCTERERERERQREKTGKVHIRSWQGSQSNEQEHSSKAYPF